MGLGKAPIEICPIKIIDTGLLENQDATPQNALGHILCLIYSGARKKCTPPLRFGDSAIHGGAFPLSATVIFYVAYDYILPFTVYQLENRVQDEKNCDVTNSWPSPTLRLQVLKAFKQKVTAEDEE